MVTTTTPTIATTNVAVPTYGSTNANGSINRFDPNTGKSTAPATGGSLGATYSDSAGQQFNSQSLANQSTTTLSSQNKQTQVPGIQATTTGLANTGATTDTNTGVTTNADGTPYTPPTTPVTSSTANGGYIGDTYYPPGSDTPKGATLTETSASNDYIMNSLNQLKSQNDANTASMIGSIQSQYQNLIDQQKQTNTAQEGTVNNALLMGGVTGQGSSAQYAPVSSAGIVQAQVSYGLSKISDLVSKEQSSIAAAQQAGLENDFQLQDKLNNQVIAIRKEKQDAVKKIQDDLDKAKKDIYDQVTKPIQDMQAEAAKNGADAKTLAAIANSKDVNSAIANSGGFLQTATGTLGDYLQYKRDMQAKGLVPLDYQTYKDQQDAKTAKLKATEAYSTAYNTEAGKNAAGGGTGGNTEQQKLEQQGRQVIAKEFSARTGALGTENAKVNTANHLNALFTQYYDPKTGNYNIPSNQYNEIAIGLANLVSSGGQAGETTIANINAATAKGDLNKAIQYATGSPQNGNTQAMIKNALDSVDRQAQTAERNRQAALDNMIDILPTDLEQSRKDALIKGTQMVQYEGNERIAKTTVDNLLKTQGSTTIDTAEGPKSLWYIVPKLYETPGATDSDVIDYLKAKGIIQN